MNSQWTIPRDDDTKESYINMNLKYQQGTEEEVKMNYEEWAVTYDKDCALLKWMAPTAIAQMASRLTGEEAKDEWNILDVGSGTGLVGKSLRSNGFQGEITALDYCRNMVERTTTLKDIYRNSIYHCLTSTNPLPFESDGFNLVVAGGSFGPSTIQPDCIKDIFRVLRVGGIFILTNRISEQMGPFNESLKEVFRELCNSDVISEVTASEEFDLYEWDINETEKERIRSHIFVYKKC